MWIPKENDRAEKWRKASVEEVFSHGETLVVDIETEEEIVLDSKDAKNYCNHEVFEQPGEQGNLMLLEHKPARSAASP